MTIFEAKGSCEGVNFTSHRGQHGKSARNEEIKITNENNRIDELSDEIAHITLKEYSRESAAENEIKEKLGELTISSVTRRENEDKENDATHADTVDECDHKDGVRQQLKLNVTELTKANKLNDNEAIDKTPTQKNTTLDLNIIVNEDTKISNGNGKDNSEDEDEKTDGELYPRSPMRKEHANFRCEPYQGAPRSRHHSSGGFCVAEATTNYSIDSTKWTHNLNIPIQYPLDTGFPSPPQYPFSCGTSPADSSDEGIYDVLSPEIIFEQSNCDSLPELLPQEELREAIQLLEKQGIFEDILPPPISNVGFSECNQIQPNSADDTCSSIPLSVAEFDRASTECVSGSRTIDYSPLSASSGYYSSFSPYSTTSSPSPSSSLKGSQEKINVGCNEQIYGNNGNIGYDTTSPYLGSSADTDYTECSSVQTNISILGFNSSPEYLGSQYDESLLSSVHFQKPEMVVASKPKPLAPKPTLSTLSGKEQMDKKMNSWKKERAWVNLSSKSDEDVTKADPDGDTQLMILLLTEPQENDCKLEMIYALVERLSKIENTLTPVNHQGQSALYQVALFSVDEHAGLITRYIAETLLRIGAPVDTVYKGGLTLLHILCEHGAKRYKVLQELLSMNRIHNCFNLNQFNDEGMTPLHVAVKSHQGTNLDSSSIIRLLIEAGANATLLTENPLRCSALHLAIKKSCDPNLIDALLTSPSVVASCGEAPFRQETVLHLVAQRNDLPLSQQSKLYKKFVELKAHKDVRDTKGKLPWDLVSADRKEAIKKMLLQK